MQATYDQDDFPPGFTDDVSIARKTLMMLAPFLSLTAIERMLPSFEKAIAKGVRVCIFIQKPFGWENRRSLSEVQLAKVQQLETGIHLLRAIGAHVTLRDRVHVKVAVIDMAIYWHGSLNMLSFNPNFTDDEMTREENVFEACAAVGRQKLDKCSICIEHRRKVRQEDFVINAESLSRIITNARKSKELSQKHVAHECGMVRSTVSRIEIGEQIPQTNTFAKMAQACGFSLAIVPDHALPFIEKFLETASYAFPEMEMKNGEDGNEKRRGSTVKQPAKQSNA